ncbi:MAG TPA: hypothetical protein VJC15_03645, partial [Candidatus Paceibacterota bacterium]
LSGGFTETEAADGGVQRKVAYVNGNWYAFYEDGTDSFYKKSSDGSTWGSAVDLDSTDADNIAPSIWVEGTLIYAAWRDTGAFKLEVRTINTASSDALGTLCSSGANSATNRPVSIAVADDGTVYVLDSDSLFGRLLKLTYSGCSFTDITSGSGLESGDSTNNQKPTLTTIGNSLHMVFQQNGSILSHAVYNGTSWVVRGGSLSESESGTGGRIRTIVFVNNNWYVFYIDRKFRYYKKSSDGVTWGSAVTLASTGNNASGLVAPSVWVEGTTIYAAWLNDAGGPAVRTINTASSDALGTTCTGTNNSTNNGISIAVVDDGTVYLATHASSQAVWKLTYSGCTFTDVTTDSGLTASDVPVVTTIGNNLHMVFQDGDISHSIYNGTSWSASNTQIAAQTDSVYSLTTDGTNLWLLTVDSTTAAAFYKYNGTTWSTETSPWTGQTNLTSVSLTYDSTNSDLYGFAIKDTTEQAYFKSTDAATISWGSETSFGYSANSIDGLGNISSPQEGAGTSQIGVSLRNGEDYMFGSLTPTTSTVVDFGRVDSDADAVYSLTTDGVSLWLLTVDSTTAAAFYKCASCASSSSWTSLTSPWTGQTNLTSVSLTYDSTNSDLYAFAIHDTSEQAYWESTDATTISWSGETSFAFTAGDLGHISSPETAAGGSQIASTLRQGTNYEFAWADATAPTTPGTPSTATPTTDTTPTWTWTASTDSGSGLHATDTYTVQWDTDANFGAASSATSTSATFTHTTTLADGTWYARVKAKDAASNESGFSASSSVLVDTTVPTTPGTPSATTPTSDNTPEWTWTASTDSGAGLHSTEAYIFEWSTDSSFVSGVSSSTASTASFTHTTSLADGTWYFRAKAKDAVDNESSFSSNGSKAIDTSVPSSGGGTSGSAEATKRFLQEQGFLPSEEPPPPPFDDAQGKPPIVERIPDIFQPFIPDFLKPKPEPPLDSAQGGEIVPEEAPLVFQGKWQHLSYTQQNLPFERFVFAPLPEGIARLADKFPQLAQTLEEVGVSKIIDLERLRAAKLTLPGLAQLAKLQAGIPTEVVFAMGPAGLIDIPAVLTVNEQGEPQQRITTIAGKPLHLTVKPDASANSVKGFLVFRSKESSARTTLFPRALPQARLGALRVSEESAALAPSLLGSIFFATPAFAQTYDPADIETRLVLLEFDYTGPDQDGIYTAEIEAPVVEGEYEIITVIEYEDPELGTRAIRLITVVDPEGYVYRRIGSEQARVANATVSLFWLNQETNQYELWSAKDYQQENPQVTDITGRYSFLVPEGSYYLKVESPKYPAWQSDVFSVKEGSGIHQNIELKTKYWWLTAIDWKFVVMIIFGVLLFYNFWRDKILKRRLFKI